MWLVPTLVMRGTGAGSEARELAGVVHAHLRDDDLIGGVGREEREGQPDEVVEVAGGGVHPEARAKPRGEHVLGRGLAHGARHADDGPLGVEASPRPRKAQEELLAVIPLGAQQGTAVALGRLGAALWGGTGQHDGRRARERLGREGVAVDALPRKRDEGDAFRRLARVERHRADDAVARPGDTRRPRRLKNVSN